MKRRKAYTKGDLNRLIDATLHPLTKQNPSIMILDGVIHALIEQNSPQSTLKFIKYSLPDLIAQVIRDPKRNRARRD